MTYPAPRLFVTPSGGMGEVFVRVEGELRPVRIFYQIDELTEGAEWTPGYTFPSPGLYRLSGFNNLMWYNFTAMHVNSLGDPISPPAAPIKCRPEFITSVQSIAVLREDSTQYVPGRTAAFRMRVSVWPIRGMDTSVFLYRREAFGLGAATRDVFVAVCKPGDLTKYPAGALGSSAYYRLDYVDLLDRAVEEREETWEALLEDLTELTDTLELVSVAEGTE